jgi:hypothetical protein
MGAEDSHDQTAPAEMAGHEGQQRRGMIAADDDDVGSVELKRPHAEAATTSTPSHMVSTPAQSDRLERCTITSAPASFATPR